MKNQEEDVLKHSLIKAGDWVVPDNPKNNRLLEVFGKHSRKVLRVEIDEWDPEDDTWTFWIYIEGFDAPKWAWNNNNWRVSKPPLMENK